ncbi:LRR [Seminavis robusta]|uniref:LRR n=1 Tax=Seminavis robusta TaxID=568900 RepID=A0A9N8HD18_9STRA|nr:LRR [Seminavis robusta]|eukprot:Sro325_g117740.1 LRR (655) ;mRNA; f:16062-18107
MPRSSSRRRGKRSKRDDDEDNEQEEDNDNNVAAEVNPGGNRQLPSAVRARQRAIAEREAARLARPERRATSTLGHADRKKSAVTSTPFGILASSNASAGAEEESTGWCGPFTVARQMIAAREDIKRQREADMEDTAAAGTDENHPLDQAMQELEEEKRKRAHPSLQWKSRVVTPDAAAATTNKKKKQRIQLPTQSQNKNKIPSLYQLCVDFVVTNFDHVEALGNVGHDIRTSIAHSLASQNRLDATALAALTEDHLEALELVDCADIPQDALVDCIQNKASQSLRYLQLDQAGRCFGKQTVETLIGNKKKGSVPLFALSIGGAYLLKDDDAARLIAALSSTLQSLAWKACPLLGMEFCKSIPANFGGATTQQTTLLEFSLEDITLSRESWEALIIQNDSDGTDGYKWQRNLKSLTLKRVTNLQDDLVVSLLQGAPNLEHVDLSDNYDLTDATLAALRPSSGSCLRSLHLYHLRKLTSVGLETLFTPGLEGMGPPPQLKVLNLSHASVDAVTDNVMELVLQSASMKTHTTTTAVDAGLSLLGGMVRLELQGAAITDTTLERLVATSAKTLEYLQVSFCPHITDQGLGYLVDSLGNQLEEVQIWGCAQITEKFWNGHARAVLVEGDKPGGTSFAAVVPLQITGAWMKKSGIASIRS